MSNTPPEKPTITRQDAKKLFEVTKFINKKFEQAVEDKGKFNLLPG